VSPNTRQIDEPIDLAQRVTAWDVPLQAEATEQRFLHHPPFAHHRPNLPSLRRSESRRSDSLKRSFSTLST
jgi:hypothetical protein